ncbi:DnaB-like helicase C-terminal domain-containing protein, partial [Klebsiella pneumoniae]|uniref:DnaB-like helicase C-terminal domain-containing protein n=1 Tax=Klebsiella pneumoniae TaxID=573 RepID=UPI0025A1756A
MPLKNRAQSSSSNLSTAFRRDIDIPPAAEIALVVIDYLALIKIQSTARYDLAVGEVSKGLKNLAKSNKTP